MLETRRTKKKHWHIHSICNVVDVGCETEERVSDRVGRRLIAVGAVGCQGCQESGEITKTFDGLSSLVRRGRATRLLIRWLGEAELGISTYYCPSLSTIIVRVYGPRLEA